MAVVDDLLDDSERAELQRKARPCAIKLRLHEARGLNCDRDEAVLCSSHGGGLFYHLSFSAGWQVRRSFFSRSCADVAEECWLTKQPCISADMSEVS